MTHSEFKLIGSMIGLSAIATPLGIAAFYAAYWFGWL